MCKCLHIYNRNMFQYKVEFRNFLFQLATDQKENLRIEKYTADRQLRGRQIGQQRRKAHSVRRAEVCVCLLFYFDVSGASDFECNRFAMHADLLRSSALHRPACARLNNLN